jgi:hypothetical protein
VGSVGRRAASIVAGKLTALIQKRRRPVDRGPKEATMAWDELALREEIVEAFAELGVGGFAAEMEERVYRRYQARNAALREHALPLVASMRAPGHVAIRETRPASSASIAPRLRLEDPDYPPLVATVARGQIGGAR